MAIGKEKERIVAIVPKEIAEQIAKLAEQEKRSVSAMAAIILEKGLQTFQTK